MSSRETQLKSFTLSSIGGVNERVYVTELPPEQYSSLIGLFPEFTGLQSRIFGKRVLKKYANPIYSIYQAWTPYGYGVGLYQFTGEIDFGYWLTPISNFDLTIPPLGIDLGGMTLDDFGNPYGSQFDYSGQNACVMSFLNGGTDHSACAPAPTNVGTPNDHNGGPAGQGKDCDYEVAIDEYNLSDFTVSQVAGGIPNQTVLILDQDNCRNGFGPPCVDFPPLPEAIQAVPPYSFSTQTPDGVISASSSLKTFVVFNPASHPFCFSRTTISQTNNVASNKLTINLTPLMDVKADSVKLVLTRTPGGEVEIPLTVSDQDQVLTATDYLVLGAATPNADNGFDQSGSVSGDTIRVRSRKRVCV